MLCQKCQKRVANIQFTQIVNGNKHVLYLCEHCAKDEGKISVGNPLSINDFFSGLMDFPYRTSPQTSKEEYVCDKCNMTYEEFQKAGRFGCENCYEIFADKLLPILRRLHGNVQYHGKIPAKIYKTVQVSREINKLKELLGKAIKSEEYEKAADIRDKIRSLETN